MPARQYRRGPLSKAERDRRIRHRLCLYCGGAGHMKAECLKRPSRPIFGGAPQQSRPQQTVPPIAQPSLHPQPSLTSRRKTEFLGAALTDEEWKLKRDAFMAEFRNKRQKMITKKTHARASEKENESSATSAEGSRLLKLPAELRLEVYEQFRSLFIGRRRDGREDRDAFVNTLHLLNTCQQLNDEASKVLCTVEIKAWITGDPNRSSEILDYEHLGAERYRRVFKHFSRIILHFDIEPAEDLEEKSLMEGSLRFLAEVFGCTHKERCGHIDDDDFSLCFATTVREAKEAFRWMLICPKTWPRIQIELFRGYNDDNRRAKIFDNPNRLLKERLEFHRVRVPGRVGWSCQVISRRNRQVLWEW